MCFHNKREPISAIHTHPLHTVDDQSALAGLSATSAARERSILQSSYGCIRKICSISDVFVNGRCAETQCLLETLWTCARRDFGTLNEHKVHGDGSRNGLRLIGARLKLQQLSGCGSNGQLIDSNQAETQELGRI